MRIRPAHFIALLCLMVLFHVFANFVGLYEQRIIWIDKVLHIMAGVGVAMIWVWVLQTCFKIALETIPKVMTVTSLLGFVLFAAIVWEVFEFAFWIAAPAYAVALNLYSPTIFDVLSDLVTNLIGAILFAAVLFRGRRSIPGATRVGFRPFM